MNDLAKKLLESPDWVDPKAQANFGDEPAFGSGPNLGHAASDASEELQTALLDFEPQLESISNIVFELAGELSARCQCDPNEITEAILDAVREQVSR